MDVQSSFVVTPISTQFNLLIEIMVRGIIKP